MDEPATPINFVPPISDDGEQIAISGEDTIQQAIVKLLKLARREVLMILPAMHTLLDDARISQSLLDFVRESAQREVLILMNSLENQMPVNHQLVKLSQRISSRIQLKQTSSLAEPPVMNTDYLVIVDQQHVLRIDDIEKFSAWFDVNHATRARQYAESLLQQWPKAKEIIEFRQFHL